MQIKLNKQQVPTDLRGNVKEGNKFNGGLAVSLEVSKGGRIGGLLGSEGEKRKGKLKVAGNISQAVSPHTPQYSPIFII